MLTDIERKVLTILNNYRIKHHRGPSFDELRDKTGRVRKDMEPVLRTLQTERYISWDGRDPSTVTVLHSREF